MSAANDEIFEFILRGDVSDLERMDDWVLRIADQVHLSVEVTHSLRLCLTEAVTNIIVHGGPDPSGIVVSIQGVRDMVTALIRDGARAFDPLSYVPGAIPTSLEEARIGGNGIRLMRKLASSLSYRREADR